MCENSIMFNKHDSTYDLELLCGDNTSDLKLVCGGGTSHLKLVCGEWYI